jgi:hypothetical protein
MSTTSYSEPQVFPQTQTCHLFISTDFKDFGSIAHMPPIELCFQTSPKSSQKEVFPLYPSNPPQGNTIPHMWRKLAP